MHVIHVLKQTVAISDRPISIFTDLDHVQFLAHLSNFRCAIGTRVTKSRLGVATPTDPPPGGGGGGQSYNLLHPTRVDAVGTKSGVGVGGRQTYLPSASQKSFDMP